MAVQLTGQSSSTCRIANFPDFIRNTCATEHFARTCSKCNLLNRSYINIYFTGCPQIDGRLRKLFTPSVVIRAQLFCFGRYMLLCNLCVFGVAMWVLTVRSSFVCRVFLIFEKRIVYIRCVRLESYRSGNEMCVLVSGRGGVLLWFLDS